MCFASNTQAEQASSRAPGALTRILLQATGARGLAVGQYEGLDPLPDDCGAANIRHTQGLKTGALLAAGAETGVVVAGVGPAAPTDMRAHGLDIGPMLQQRDFAAATAPHEQVGQDVRRDVGTATVVELAGTKAATAVENPHMRQAFGHFRGAPRPNPLEDLLVELFGPSR